MDFLRPYAMRNQALKKIVAGILFLVITYQLSSQAIQSEKSRIRVNTKETPKELITDIQVLEPRDLKQGETFLTDLPVIPLIIKLSNPVPGAKVMVNNVEIKPTANGDIFTHSYNLLKGSANTLAISLTVDNKPVKDLGFSIIYRETTKNLSPFVTPEGKYYALIIANNTYNPNSGMMSLKRPIADATALKEVLTTRYSFDWGNVTTLYDRSKLDVEVTLEELQKRLQADDNLLIFYAGHGIMDQESDIGYWLLSDASRSRVTWLSNSTITDFIKACKARHILLIADACYAGSIYSSRGMMDNASPAILDLIKSKSRKAITSGGTTEVADESKFAQILVEQLKTNTEQYLPSLQLYNLLQKPVLANSLTSPRWGSINNVGDDNGDFVFILKTP
jgi:hypothetical protein